MIPQPLLSSQLCSAHRMGGKSKIKVSALDAYAVSSRVLMNRGGDNDGKAEAFLDEGRPRAGSLVSECSPEGTGV